MEVKSNVRQRRMDRMKQIMMSERGPAPGHADAHAHGGKASRREFPDRDGRLENGPVPGYETAARDPEVVWNRQQRERWSSWEEVHERMTPPVYRQIWIRLGISAVLFGGIWGMFHMDHPLADRGREWVDTALTEDYPFSALAGFYERKFGGLPSFLPAMRAKPDTEAQKASSSSLRRLYAPVHGKIIGEPHADDLGITLRTLPDAPVAALDTGRVMSVTETANMGTVVVIQHAGGLQSTYGWLKQTPLIKNDWVEGGETIGQVTTDPAGGAGKLYVAVKRDNQPVSPTDVVSFD